MLLYKQEKHAQPERIFQKLLEFFLIINENQVQ